jgi:hypothetical protein
VPKIPRARAAGISASERTSQQSPPELKMQAPATMQRRNNPVTKTTHGLFPLTSKHKDPWSCMATLQDQVIILFYLPALPCSAEGFHLGLQYGDCNSCHRCSTPVNGKGKEGEESWHLSFEGMSGCGSCHSCSYCCLESSHMTAKSCKEC